MESDLNRLVDEMGFARYEAKMALDDASGNVELAIEKLLAGEYNPPPYSCQDVGASPDAKSVPPSQEQKYMDESNQTKGLYPLLPSNPPPYSTAPVNTAIREWEQGSGLNFFRCDEISFENNDVRCSTCFNPIEEKGGDRAVKEGMRMFHYNCFMKSRGPKCAHCCFSLELPNKDRGFSGQYLIYNGKNYHVECYEKYAGPRCSKCFNVIIERQNGEHSGRWTQEGLRQFHEECYYKKQYAEYRAKTA